MASLYQGFQIFEQMSSGIFWGTMQTLPVENDAQDPDSGTFRRVEFLADSILFGFAAAGLIVGSNVLSMNHMVRIVSGAVIGGSAYFCNIRFSWIRKHKGDLTKGIGLAMSVLEFFRGHRALSIGKMAAIGAVYYKTVLESKHREDDSALRINQREESARRIELILERWWLGHFAFQILKGSAAISARLFGIKT